MKAPVIIPVLLFASLLLAAGCGGGGSNAQSGSAPATTAPGQTAPATTGVGTLGLFGEVLPGPVQGETTQATTGTPQSTLTIINSAGEKVPVQVEVANTPDEQERGLMERTSLAQDAGMLFVFDQEQPLSFWMKDTLIPLSIAFIDSSGRIVDIQDMQPLDETNHISAEPAQYALEVNQDFFANHGIEVGNVLQ